MSDANSLPPLPLKVEPKGLVESLDQYAQTVEFLHRQSRAAARIMLDALDKNVPVSPEHAEMRK